MTPQVPDNIKAGLRCLCCGDARTVESAWGGQRPCSRCQPEAFHRWADETRRNARAKREAGAA